MIKKITNLERFQTAQQEFLAFIKQQLHKTSHLNSYKFKIEKYHISDSNNSKYSQLTNTYTQGIKEWLNEPNKANILQLIKNYQKYSDYFYQKYYQLGGTPKDSRTDALGHTYIYQRKLSDQMQKEVQNNQHLQKKINNLITSFYVRLIQKTTAKKVMQKLVRKVTAKEVMQKINNN